MNQSLLLGLALVSFLFQGCQSTRKIAQSNPETKDYLKPQSYDQLSLYTPYKYEVLFTDPICGPYKYTKEMLSQSGKKLIQKPENVYCKGKYDRKKSGDQLTSPQYRLVEWINHPNTTEIFFTYLSFSNPVVKEALCEAASKRNVKVKFVLDAASDKGTANDLLACSSNVEMKARGQEGGLGYAHNKIFIINPNTPGEFKMVFSSGNMTSGPVIHHENWNFITTNSQSQFAQAHLCAMKAEWSDESGKTRKAYMQSIRKCRAEIKTPVERDIKVFFIPGEGEVEKSLGKQSKTASEYLLNGDGLFPGIANSSKIWLACHRFLYNKMIDGLNSRMSSSAKPDMRIIADDDSFYVVNDKTSSAGGLMASEYHNIKNLTNKGAQVKYMETNQDEHQLHHSKYLIFADKTKKFTALFTGSANLTGAGFKTNWENSYYVTIPEVVQKFADHYEVMWNTMATATEDLPKFGSAKGYLEEAPSK